MKKEIFPKEILERSVEVHEFSHHTKSKAIYSLILLMLLSAFVLLPFIFIDVYVSARGIIAPDEERIMLAPIQSGKVIFAAVAPNQWEAKHADYQQTLEELQSTQKQLTNSRGNNVLVAPAAGTLLEVVGLNTNGFVQAGQPIAKLSPDSNLMVECYVAPTDIGYLEPGKKVAFKIDAYNYNQWGLAHGTVNSISDDIELIDGKPVFTLRCQIDTPTLRLKNGVEGTLKKGMTLTAQFVLTRRSLFDLLYDNLDDWLNPAEKHE